MEASYIFSDLPRRGIPATPSLLPFGDNYAIEYIHAVACRRHHSSGPCRRTLFRRDGTCSRRPCDLGLSGFGWNVDPDGVGHHHRAGLGDRGFSRGHYHCTGCIDGSVVGGHHYDQ